MKRILFVCTGNTCRSFIAEQLLKCLLRKAEDDSDDNKAARAGDFKVSSAGLFAVEDDEANDEALEVLEEEYGIETGRHKARQITEEMVEDADFIITLDDAHKHGVVSAYPEAEDKTITLLEMAYGEDGEDGTLDIEDPYRGDKDDYKECAATIYRALECILPELLESDDE